MSEDEERGDIMLKKMMSSALCLLLIFISTSFMNANNPLQNQFADTVKIILQFHPQYPGDQPAAIIISDKKVISDLLGMIKTGKPVKDQNLEEKMSGMAKKDNSLTLWDSAGKATKLLFSYDDSLTKLGDIEIGNVKYDPGYDFFRYIDCLNEYRSFSTTMDNSDITLFQKYKWTVDYKINTFTYTLPTTWKLQAGEYPVKIYWAYNNVFSKQIGMDYSIYAGKNVTVELYRLREALPSFMKPRLEARGVVLKYQKHIIGAYIDAGRHSCFACSLDRKDLKGITKKAWAEWIADYIDNRDLLTVKLSKLSPEEVIRQYFKALDEHDTKTQFACLSIKNNLDYLAVNMDNNKLINESYEEAYSDGYTNVISSKLIKIEPADMSGNPEGMKEYAATVDFIYKKVITEESGRNIRFVQMIQETPGGGWKITSMGTGP